MFDTMQHLYGELWGKQLSVIEPRTFSIPQPQHSLRPGYMVDLKEIKDEAFLDREFAKGKEEQVFQVLKVRSELLCGMNQLLIRQEFETIECKLWEVVSEKWTNVNPKTGMPVVGLNLDYQVAGQLGSGKSFFLSYLLVLRILKGQPTVFRFHDHCCYLFDSNSKGSKTDADSLFDLPKNQKKVLWIMMDEKLEDAGWNMKGHGWFVVQVTLPKKVQNSRQWEKDRNVGSHYMSNWGWGEIVAAFSLAKPKPSTPCQMAMLFTTFTCLGPIPRTCLESISMRNDNAYNHDLKTYLGYVDRKIDTFILQGGYLMVEGTIHQEASHRIAIMDPTDDGLSYKARITMRWIAHQVFKKVQRKWWLNCFKLYKQLTHQDLLQSTAGWFFEGYAHDWFGKGRSFEADKLPVKNNNTHLKFRTCRSKSRNYFTDANNLATQVRVEDAIRKYFLPYNTNFELVDGLVFSALNTLILLQITITNSHPVKLRAVKSLYQSLPPTIENIHIVFIILEDHISQYSRAQSVPEAGDVKPGATGLTINQFRLVLTEETIHLMAVDGPFKVRDGGRDADESGSRDYDGGDTVMGGTQ
ncbi:hypothetical protein L873DRAFT_1929528 [Choiromyces venosus 120613-1]|uniref:Uncharacterized protein n=1 Tax=Choiromyces venosus 120613-1 TaxID=1336337 RepID=A0A3N4JC09_9PEZI|nr:hypothetical protein L873DRAFT_1929528 [Choiromyces venosus 120613-1]